jgi:type I restriction enzyme S subunit
VSEALIVTREAVLRQFKQYPAYRSSGVEWLGDIPTHWEAKRLKYVAPVTDERSHSVTLDLPYLGLEHVEPGTGRLVGISEGGITEDGALEGAASLFRPGDVLFGKLRPYLAKVLRPEFAGRCSTELLVLRSIGEIAPSVLAYQLLSRDFIGWVDAMTYGAKMPRANPDQISNIPVALAPPQEQRTIAAFLDRETARIDALVAKKERLIELLEEMRTALITSAVTRKGLDPNVAMKDSGVEWLGDIPMHWDMKPLRWVLSIRSGEALSNMKFELTETEDCAVPVIGGNGVMGYGNLSNISAPSIAVGRVGALCGNVHLSDPPAWVTDNALLISNIQWFDRQYASSSPSKPLASVTKRPERSPFGKGCEPQAGEPPVWLGLIQIWKIRVGFCSRLYSACRMPAPALITCTSPASVRPSFPRLSLWVIAPSRT